MGPLAEVVEETGTVVGTELELLGGTVVDPPEGDALPEPTLVVIGPSSIYLKHK